MNLEVLSGKKRFQIVKSAFFFLRMYSLRERNKNLKLHLRDSVNKCFFVLYACG